MAGSITIGDGGGGTGAGGSGGVPAAHLEQVAGSQGAQDLGLFIGLEHAEAGVDWRLVKAVRDTDATQATLRWSDNVNGVTVTIPASVASGVDGNEWGINFAFGSSNSAVLDAANKRLNLTAANASWSWATVAATINAVWTGAAVVFGSGGATAGSLSSQRFSGGAAPEAIGAEIDETNKLITIKYAAADTLQQIKDALDEFTLTNARLVANEIAETNLTLAAEDPATPRHIPFDGFYAAGQAPDTEPGPGIDAEARAAAAAAQAAADQAQTDATGAQTRADEAWTNSDTASRQASENASQISAERGFRTQGDDLQSVTISSASSYQSALTAQRNSQQPLEIFISAAIAGTRSGSPYSYNAGDVLYVAPFSDSVERRFNIPQGSTGPTTPTVKPRTADYTITSDDEGDTIVLTSNTRTFTLPAIGAGVGQVSAGFAVVIGNQGTGELTIRAASGNFVLAQSGQGAQRSGITRGQAFRYQVIDGITWLAIADTTFPDVTTKANQTDLDTEIAARIAADTALGERIDALPSGGGGGGGRKLEISPSGDNNRTIQLPTTYTDYDFIVLDVAADQHIEISVAVDLLVTTGTDVYRSGSTQRITWTPATRQFTLNSNAFHGAVLFGVTGGDAGGSGGSAGSIAVSPSNIRVHTDLGIVGDYVLAAEDLDVATLNAANVDQYEVWFKEEVVHTASWSPVADFSVTFTVNPTEMTQIGLTANDRLVPVRLVFRSSGTFVSLINTWLEIGGPLSMAALLENLDINPQHLADAAGLRLLLTAQRTAFQQVWAIATGTFTATIDTHNYDVREGDLYYFAPRGVDRIARLVYRPNDPKKQDALTNQQKAELIDVRLGIAAINPTAANLQRQIDVFFDPPAILGSTVYAEFRVAGQGPAARQLMAQAGGRVRFTLSQAQAESISNNITDDQTTIDVRINLYDAATSGNLLATVHRDLTILWQPPPVVQTLTSAAAIAWAMGNGLTADLTLAHNATITPSGGDNGETAILRVVQDATGSRTLAFSGVQTGGRRVGLSAAAGKRTTIALHKIGTIWHYMGSILDA